jgi:subtilisin family serine protease
MTEVVVTLKSPPLSAFGRSLQAASHTAYLRRVDAAQDALATRIVDALPAAQIRWRYRLVANGVAVTIPRGDAKALARIPGVEAVWPSVRYHVSRDLAGPEQIGADKLWGPAFATAGDGIKIAVIDDGLDASNPYFDANGFQYPPGFPKGQTRFATAKVIVQRTFAPPTTYKFANTPFDPSASFHATHVAGIAAGDHGTTAGRTQISGVAPNAWIGNYKALTIPTPGFGLDGNSAELAAAVEAAVKDGMNVINLSLGEPEVEPSRDLLVRALEGAAAAGVVPVVAAGNDFNDLGYGSVSSPGSAPSAITVAAADSRNVVAGFSSGGPTPLSLQMKPDVTAPGVSILSSLPASQGTFGLLSGTSMATPHVAGAAALLKERHPTWTVAQIKAALELTGTPVRTSNGGAEVPSTREGGGMVDLTRADVPLIFAAPSGLSFGELAPAAQAVRNVSLTDAGGGAGPWAVTSVVQGGAGTVAVPAAVTVPGTLPVTATAGQAAGDVTGFVVLTHGADTRRIPFWFLVSAPKLAGEKKLALPKPGRYTGTTRGAPSLVSRYRYPTAGDVDYPGPERVYRVSITGRPANFGVVVLSGRAVPHVTLDGSENRLVGNTGLPIDINPYREQFGTPVPVAGVDVPGAGAYDIVFDTRSAAQAGRFTFRYWVNDHTPPRVKVTPGRGKITLIVTDAGSGFDPSSVTVQLDGRATKVAARGNVVTLDATKGRHTVVVRASDYQETKNMENVPPILPNTATVRRTVAVR